MALRPVADAPLTLAAAAVSLASGEGEAGRRLGRALETQLLRRNVPAADRDDVRGDVVFALLVSPRGETLTLDAACAHVALVARNKAVDLYRRGAREALDGSLPERVSEAPEGALQGDLDAVAGEVHRRGVSHALRGLLRELPDAERLALTATATGAGWAGSGLARSSHYRALDRARLRLSAVVRSRVAAGLALPAVLLRTLAGLRPGALPAGALAAAVLASAAFVLPARTPPVAAYAHATVTPRLARVHTTVARQAAALPGPPVRPATPRHVRRQVRAHRVRAHAATRTRVTRLPTRIAATHSASPPAAGLDPCRAALLCQ